MKLRMSGRKARCCVCTHHINPEHFQRVLPNEGYNEEHFDKFIERWQGLATVLGQGLRVSPGAGFEGEVWAGLEGEAWGRA